MNMSLAFLGGAGTVTGSSYLLRVNGSKYLIDCGLFQGSRKLRELNWSDFPIPPEEIDGVFLTHAHIDHIGLLPRLVQQGLRAPLYATEATCALIRLSLPDSAHLQEQDAEWANKKGYSRHKPALPLYSAKDAQGAIELLAPVSFSERLSLPQLDVTWRPAGHLLGSAILEIDARTQKGSSRMVFSGDLGRYDSAFMKPPTAIQEANILLVESTYGNRRHSEQSIEDRLAQELDYILQQDGVLLIPAFAIGRAQQILYHLRQLQDQQRIGDIPVFIDSPMAVDASHIYCDYGDDHNLDVNLLMDERSCPLRCHRTHFVRDVAESKALNTMPGPAIIISASGMLTGGRILHHLKWRLPHEKNVVLFVGYQAEGTRGRNLLEGAQSIRIHGEEFPVRARVAQVQALSGHADQDELLRWLSGFTQAPAHTFITHGETEASQGLQEQISQTLAWHTRIPARGDVFEF